MTEKSPPSHDPTQSSQTQSFELNLLGTPRFYRVLADGEKIELEWRQRRCIEILAYLAHDGLRASRSRLTAAVWREDDRETVERNLHPTISDLRKGLGEKSAVRFHQGVYFLDSAFEWSIDLTRFQEAIHRGGRAADPAQAIADYEEAWRLYEGPFLNGWDRDWIDQQREILLRQWSEMLVALGELYLAQDRERDALDAYRTVLLHEPYEESVHLAVMEIYGKRRRRDLVRKQYLKLREHLGDLGVEPLAETEERFRQLMQ